MPTHFDNGADNERSTSRGPALNGRACGYQCGVAIVLGINAVFHDPSAVLIVDGELVAAAEEERFSRRKHGKDPVAFSTWELPQAAARWALKVAGLDASGIDAVGYSDDPDLA